MLNTVKKIPKWKAIDFDDCPECSGNLEAWTESNLNNSLYDSDEIRCTNCHKEGAFMCDSDGGFISWNEE